MSFVHVEPLDEAVSKRAERPHPADSEDDLLAESVAEISSIQEMGELSVGRGVLRKIGIEEVHGDDSAPDAAHLVPPRPDRDVAAFEGHDDPRLHLLKKILHHPFDRLLALPSAPVEALMEIALAVEKTHRDHGQSEIRRGTNRIPAEDSEPAGIGGHSRLEPDLHGEIGDHPPLRDPRPAYHVLDPGLC
jgi:hypothetical protein